MSIVKKLPTNRATSCAGQKRNCIIYPAKQFGVYEKEKVPICLLFQDDRHMGIFV